MGRVPPSAMSQDNCLYLRSMPSSNGDFSKPWLTNQSVGKHTLATMVKEACMEAGISGKTNHSLQATGGTTMFTAGVPEQVIQERTGQLSVDGLRCYEKTSAEEPIAACQTVAFKTDMPFQTASVTKVQPSAPTPAPGQFAFSNCTVNFYQDNFIRDVTWLQREALLEEAPDCEKAAFSVPPPPMLAELDQSLVEFDKWLSSLKKDTEDNRAPTLAN